MSNQYNFNHGQTPPPFHQEKQPGANQNNQQMNYQAQMNYREAVASMNADPVVAGKVMKGVLSKVFLYMFSGLLISGVIAIAAMMSRGFLYFLYANSWLYTGAALIQLVVVFAFSFASRKAKAGTARVLFYLYSVITGITLSVYLSIFSFESVALAFVITALTFGGMAVWGYTTKKDLSTIGAAGRMLLIGAIIASLVNLVLFFIAPGFASVLDMVLNYVVVAIFVGLTAYDMQKIKLMAEQSGVYYAGEGREAVALRETIAINGALNLYLDFINIFIRLLAITGKRK